MESLWIHSEEPKGSVCMSTLHGVSLIYVQVKVRSRDNVSWVLNRRLRCYTGELQHRKCVFWPMADSTVRTSALLLQFFCFSAACLACLPWVWWKHLARLSLFLLTGLDCIESSKLLSNVFLKKKKKSLLLSLLEQNQIIFFFIYNSAAAQQLLH